MKIKNRLAVAVAASVIIIWCIGCSALSSLSQAIDEMNTQLAAGFANADSAWAAAGTQPQAQTTTAQTTRTQQTSSAQTSASVVATPIAAASTSRELSANGFRVTPYTVLPAGTDGSAGTSGTYVLFGDWPQTIKAASVTVDESKSVKVGAHTYFRGSDGEWYIKLKSTYSSGYEGPDGYRYTDGTRVSANKILYFKVEPIKWRVVTNNYNGSGKKLLLAESILTNMSFYDCDKDASKLENIDGSQIYFKLDKNIRHKDDGTYIHHNNYEHSRLRAFLNGISYIKGDDDGNQAVDNEFVGAGFLQTAFTSDMQAAIAVTTVDNSLKSTGNIRQEMTDKEFKIYTGQQYYEAGQDHKRYTFPTFISADTKDKVFILSQTEATRSDYGFKEIPPKVTKDNFMDYLNRGEAYTWVDQITTYKALARPKTDFCRANGISHPSGSANSGWYLRTALIPGYYRDQPKIAQAVQGVTADAGLDECSVKGIGTGVVPAICVNY